MFDASNLQEWLELIYSVLSVADRCYVKFGGFNCCFQEHNSANSLATK